MAGSGRRGPGGRLLALGGLGAVAAVGFAFGVLAGAFWEQPGLVASFAVGATERVAWGPDRQAETLPAVGAPRGVTEREDPEPRVRAEETAPSSSPAGEGFAVQVGAFAERAAAERLAESLRAKGLSVYISAGAKEGAARWRVRVGPLATREQAERTAARLKRDEKLPTWVLSEDAA